MVVNLDVPTTADDLVELAAHEVYPGHHTEHALKEQRLLRDRGLLEESLQLVPTPQALVSEGIAEVGPHVVLDEGAFEELSSILRRHGIDYDVALARELRRAKAPLRSVGLDAALLIHEHGATEAEAQAWVERWGPAPPERAAHTVQFALDPTWRAYAVTYSAGRELAGAYVGDDATRFVRLLTEQVRVGELLASLSSGA